MISTSDDNESNETVLDETASQVGTILVKPLWKIWMLEVLCILGGLSAFAAIVVVLAIFDQQQLPNWPLKISLNTLLALLAILAKAAFMVPVSTAISQAQWSWFSQPRPLHHFQLMDQASRGPVGSAKLALRVRHKHFITLGAVLSIISVLTSPITQLAINYPDRNVADGGELTAHVSALRGLSHLTDNVAFAANSAIQMASLPSTAVGTYNPMIPLGAVCPTGNCTFSRYNTLGVCMQKVSVTQHLIVEEMDDPSPEYIANLADSGTVTKFLTLYPGIKLWNVTVPGGDVSLVHQSHVATALGMLNGRRSLAFSDDSALMQTRLASFVLIHTATAPEDDANREAILQSQDFRTMVSNIRNVHHEAVEVIFHLCVQTYDTAVNRGIERTEMVQSLALPAPGQDPDFYLNMNCSSLIRDALQRCLDIKMDSNKTIQLQGPGGVGPGSEEFVVTNRAMQQISMELWSALNGISWDTFSDPNPGPLESGFAVSSAGSTVTWNLFEYVLFQPVDVVDGAVRDERMYSFFYNIAAAISYRLRDASAVKVSESAYNITGQAWRRESYVDISWGWITYLAVELVLAGIFLALTIHTQAKARRRSEDKTSSAASLMFHDYKDAAMAPLLALSTECRAAAGGGLQPRGEMKKMAKRLLVKFRGNEVVVAGTVDGKEEV
ncbi:hypothetical protein QBC43DRAFT_198702 [Cladorrhinum sp. PSN259]|nr:hypothetical protein QBC43DRAFT_198702 [Cladorrhinum sp. PSN259]